ncbi:MAG: hypothetical protein K0R17_1173 [Rariglobus sp.]|jgi:hypothetical protein|nr:hypothetical protein [Rariglobus sp.]
MAVSGVRRGRHWSMSPGPIKAVQVEFMLAMERAGPEEDQGRSLARWAN